MTMKNEDLHEFTKLLVEAGHAFSIKISQGQRDVYWKYLRPFSIEVVQQAVSDLIIGSENFPTVSAILKRALNNQKSHTPSAFFGCCPYHDKGSKIKDSERG
jgi:hypothetical protein